MKKTELENKLTRIEKELKELKAILDKDPEEYAEELNKEHKMKHKFEPNETYPYKVGVTQSIIKYILEGDI